MSASATSRLHVVNLSADELDEQVSRGRDVISFAVERTSDSPGYGRIAVIVTRDAINTAYISHLGLVKKGSSRTNLDATWVLSSIREIASPIKVSGLEADLGRFFKDVRYACLLRRGGSLSPAASAALRSVIRARIGTGEWPEADGLPEWMVSRLAGDIQQDHTNAIGTALKFSDMDLSRMRTVPLPDESPLANLALSPSEASLIDNDLRNFPGMDATQLREDIVRLTDRRHTLDVMNVNATRIETATGVDLIYFNHDYQSFVLVQYKRMSAAAGGRIAGIDARLPDQLKRMIAFDEFAGSPTDKTNPVAYRLGTGATFTKFAYPVTSPIREADLTRGLYVPSQLLDCLLRGGHLRGPQGGEAVTHENLARWLSNDQFADLVKKGWIGSISVTTPQVQDFIAASLEHRRVAIIAAHSTNLDPDDDR